MPTTYRHRHAVRTGEQARLHGMGASARKRSRTQQINDDFAAAVAAAEGRVITLADAAKRLGVTTATARRYCYAAAGRPARLTAARDESGHIVGVVEKSMTGYRKARAEYRRKVAAYRASLAA